MASASTWTPTTLTAQIVGELNTNPNADGGTVPARLTNIVDEAYHDLWEEWDFKFRRIRGTLTTVASTATVILGADFAKLDELWVKENNRNGTLVFTDDVQLFDDAVYRNQTQGPPRLAFVEPDTALTTSFLQRIRVTPTPDAVYTYPYSYLRYAPDLGSTSIPLWPLPFHRGWHYLALARAQRAFRRDEAWKETFAAYNAWLERAKSNNDETLASDTPIIRDATGDWAALPSTILT